MNLLKGINVVSISVSDLDQARQFYRDILGLGEPIYDLPDAGWIEFSSGNSSGNIAVTKAEEGWKPSTGTTVVFNVDDCHTACTELRRAGFYDLFGNRLQMCSPAPAESS